MAGVRPVGAAGIVQHRVGDGDIGGDRGRAGDGDIAAAFGGLRRRRQSVSGQPEGESEAERFAPGTFLECMGRFFIRSSSSTIVGLAFGDGAAGSALLRIGEQLEAGGRIRIERMRAGRIVVEGEYVGERVLVLSDGQAARRVVRHIWVRMKSKSAGPVIFENWRKAENCEPARAGPEPPERSALWQAEQCASKTVMPALAWAWV